MGPNHIGHTTLTINGEEVGTLGEFSLVLNEPTCYSEAVKEGTVTATISFKMNRWSRFKTWLLVQKQKFTKEKSYSIELVSSWDGEE
jgi:hypothetical protein